ncbi:MAG: ATP-dependent DNA helicase [Candidatus Ozemobacteraceae bacterium]
MTGSQGDNATGGTIKVAIRDLVEFVFQSGDLQASTFVGSNRALAGIRGHQKIQKSRPDNYEAEVSISHIYRAPLLSDPAEGVSAFPGLSIELRGRIDGIWHNGDAIILDEIKTTTLPLSDITCDNQPLHWAQAKVYGYIFALQNGLRRIGIQLSYLQLDSLETLEYNSEFAFSELENFFFDVISQYLEWAMKIREWQSIRDSSIKRLAFPFIRYREGQRKLAVAVYRAIADGKNLFAQAPTGIGKTVATIFPSLKALGEGKIAKIFYLTAKTVGRGVAEQSLAGLSQAGLQCKVLTLTAKEKICFLSKPDCRPDVCEYARGYFDRVKSALTTIFEKDRFDRETIEVVAKSARVCPFEFSLFLSLWADVIICDYNYAFDPRVYLRRFFDPPTDEYVFLIDEAHNLPDRAREMFSAELRKSQFSSLRKQAKTVYPSIIRTIGRITPFFSRLEKTGSWKPGGIAETTDGGENISLSKAEGLLSLTYELPTDLIQALRKFLKLAEEHLIGSEPSSHRDALLDLFFKVSAFVRVSETFDESFVCYAERIGGEKGIGGGRSTEMQITDMRVSDVRRTDVRVKLFCLDPTPSLKTALKRTRSAIFFSATLLPMKYFFRILGGTSEDWTLVLESPFASAQLGLMVIPGIRTEFRVREKSFASIAEIIHTTVSSRQGNYLVYFPSYRYMAAVRELFVAGHQEWKTIEQKTGMTEEAREEFLRNFSADNSETLIGFVVMGGIFGEGIDLRGERLIGSIVVGVGLPQICLERDLIRAYFQGKFATGFEVAYRYPGMNRVMQAAGRVIRTEEDRGIVILIDERFMQNEYRKLFPREWSHFLTVSAEKIDGGNAEKCGGKSVCDGLKRALEIFWKKTREPDIHPE